MNWKKKWFNTTISMLVVSLLFVACNTDNITVSTEKDSRVETLPYYNDATFTPHWIVPGSDSLKDFHKIPAFVLVNQDGDTVTEKDFEGHIYVTDFFFTSCPGICPKMTASMGVLQDEFEDDNDLLLLSHSVTPVRDSVSVLNKYAKLKGVQSGKWHLVTGSRQEIYNLGRYSYFVEEDLGLEKETDDFLHTENFVLIDKNLYIRGIYNGLNKAAIQQLIADIKTLEGE